MKRTIPDVLRRGFLSVVANWPVIVTRVIETFVMVGLIIVAAVLLIVPMLVSAGMNNWSLPAGRNPSEVIAAILVEHAALFAYLLGFVLVMGLLMVAIHSFVIAGATRIFVDAERAVPDTPEPRREQFDVFSMERWGQGARAGWGRVFWIYNGAWGMWGLILLIPVLLVGALTVMAVRADNVPATFAAACGGSVLLILIAIPTGIVIAMWSQKAIVVAVARDLGAGDALRAGWREAKADFGRHFVIFFAIMVISFAAGMMVSSFAPLNFSVRHHDVFALITAPMQIAVTAIQNALASAIGCWLISAFAAMTEER